MALKVVSSLAKKGVLDRVGHGVYLVRPLRAIGRPWAISAFVAVEQSLLGTPHYIGGLGALGIHRLSEQIYSSVVDVFSPTYKPPQILASAKIRFHRMPENEIPIGKMTVLVEHLPIHVSDPERTLVDALNHPQAFGGVGEGVRAVDRGVDRVSLSKLVRYAIELSDTAPLQRLAVPIDRHGASEHLLARLAAKIGHPTAVPAMVPGPRRGPINVRWRISENDLHERGSGSPSTPR